MLALGNNFEFIMYDYDTSIIRKESIGSHQSKILQIHASNVTLSWNTVAMHPLFKSLTISAPTIWRPPSRKTTLLFRLFLPIFIGIMQQNVPFKHRIVIFGQTLFMQYKLSTYATRPTTKAMQDHIDPSSYLKLPSIIISLCSCFWTLWFQSTSHGPARQ